MINYYYIFGIKSIKINDLAKFNIICFKYDLIFNLLKEINIDHMFEKSTLIWDIKETKYYLVFLIEQKSINKTIHSCEYFNYFIKKDHIENFKVSKIEKNNLKNHLISKIFDNYILSSKIERDEERLDYYWGKYLFLFYNKDIEYKPNFDKIVDYSKDKGHLLHYIEKIKDEYTIIFSIRHKVKNNNQYYYKLYTAKSVDLINFYNTKEIMVENNITETKWYCYPDVFKKDGEYFILLNQDDFGKTKKTLIGKIL